MTDHESSERKQHDEEAVEAFNESRVRMPLLKAYRAAFHAPVDLALTDSALRTIGNSYASVCFVYGPVPHPESVERLGAAMHAYVAVHPEADDLLFPAECPFGEGKPVERKTVTLREKIQAAYFAQPAAVSDSGRFERLVEEKGGAFDEGRWSLRDVTQALVGFSAKAQFINRKYFGGRFS